MIEHSHGGFQSKPKGLLGLLGLFTVLLGPVWVPFVAAGWLLVRLKRVLFALVRDLVNLFVPVGEWAYFTALASKSERLAYRQERQRRATIRRAERKHARELSEAQMLRAYEEGGW